MGIILLIYVESVLISVLLATLGLTEIVRKIYIKKYKMIYNDIETCKKNIANSKSFKDFLIPGYNLICSGMLFLLPKDKKAVNQLINDLKNDGSIDKMSAEEYTRYINTPNVLTAFRISKAYQKRLENAHVMEVKDGKIYFDIRKNEINILKSVGKISDLSIEEQIELIYENELFYKDIYRFDPYVPIDDRIKEKMFLKELKNNIIIHENKLMGGKLDKINKTKEMLTHMKNDILCSELDIMNKEKKDKVKKLIKK